MLFFVFGGMVKQFAGDEVLAIFGAPVSYPDHTQRAVKAALAMQESNRVWQIKRKESGQPTFGLKIGLHCGNVVVGSVGSRDRMEYAAVGDVVNTASRVMNLSSHFGKPTCTLASENVVVRLNSEANAELLGTQNLKGREASTDIYLLSPPN